MKHLLCHSGTGRGDALCAAGTRSESQLSLAPVRLSYRLGSTVARRRVSAAIPTETPTPARAAALALVTSRSPDASEKLIATSLPTPSARRIAAVAPTLATAPPAVTGMTPAAALRQRTASAVPGEKRRPSALSNRTVPMARVVQQVRR